ncbi:hypothetical protein [Pseudomonas cerasi]
MAAIDDLSSVVNGDISVKLYKGTVGFVQAQKVPSALYNQDNASMEAVGSFSHADSEGYLQATGQSIKMAGVVGSINQGLWHTL